MHVVDETTLAWAELRGNRQYISHGNLATDQRVSVFLMDYARRRRLKIFGSLQLLDPDQHPELRARTMPSTPPAQIQRLARLHVHAYDWNCPQHITPRYTAAELQEALTPMREQLQRLRSENDTLRAELARRPA
ncbi:hypothetical protein [Streptomyces virginiae]|uniref:hypothetical protein n=1 Tax=Streptomyces virginiae TaxID=1961 RepID=UPI00225AE74B|nr:hypothetical protein [Streptomyces virginiae]MCX4960283.1 hypothetical protein [Streptomyces virginiae]